MLEVLISWIYIGIYTFSKKASGASDEDDLILEMTSYCNRIHLQCAICALIWMS